MTENDSPKTDGPIDVPAPVIEKGRGISLVWVIPIVAILVGAAIAFDAFQNRGIHVVINLPDAEWVEAGKTKIRFLNVEAGVVDEVELSEDLKSVDLHCTLHRKSEARLTDGAKFWLVHPRVGAGGISGLGTFLSGAFVAMELGPAGGERRREFQGLVEPPLKSDSTPGLTIQLHTEELHSLGVGSPVYFREIEVGSVERHELEKDGSGVVLTVFFPDEHKDLVHVDSRFWNAGGIQISGSLTNLDVQTESLDSILSGGIAFDSPSGAATKKADKDTRFWLHPSKSEVENSAVRYGGLRVYVEGPQLGSVAIGSRVYYREIPVGAVISQQLANDSKRVRIGLNIQNRYAPLVRSNSVFWNASGISANLGLHGLEIHTESLAAIVGGGIAFATPNSPAKRVKTGSVFRLHNEAKDEWQKWSPLIWRGPGKAPVEAAQKAGGKKESGLKRFFHHENKDEESSAAAGEPQKDPKQKAAHSKKRHGFFSRMFHHDEEDTDGNGDQEAAPPSDSD
jgi:paraquat-inducible protein B